MNGLSLTLESVHRFAFVRRNTSKWKPMANFLSYDMVKPNQSIRIKFNRKIRRITLVIYRSDTASLGFSSTFFFVILHFPKSISLPRKYWNQFQWCVRCGRDSGFFWLILFSFQILKLNKVFCFQIVETYNDKKYENSSGIHSGGSDLDSSCHIDNINQNFILSSRCSSTEPKSEHNTFNGRFRSPSMKVVSLFSPFFFSFFLIYNSSEM